MTGKQLLGILSTTTAVLIAGSAGVGHARQSIPDLTPFVGEWGGHLVEMTINADGLATIHWRAGREIKDGAFVTSADGTPDATMIVIERVDGPLAFGRVLSSSDGLDRPGTPVLLRLEEDCTLTVQYGGGTVRLAPLRCAERLG